MTNQMTNEQFKAQMMASLNAIREQIPAKRIALDLYQLYGMQGNVETYQRRIRSCFDPERPEFFTFADVVNMMLLYGIHEPFLALCDVLGYERPARVDTDTQIQLLKRQIAEGEAELAAQRERLQELVGEGNTRGIKLVGARFSKEQ